MAIILRLDRVMADRNLAQNKTSVRVMEHCGFRKLYEGMGDYQGERREICRFVYTLD